MSKPVCSLLGTDGNAFALIGKVSKTLKNSGLRDEANEFQNKAFNSESYDALLVLIGEYVEIR